jgi:hypothetical protein
MDEIKCLSGSPLVIALAQPSTVTSGYRSVEMTVFVSVDGHPPDAFQMLIRMPSKDALDLANQLTTNAKKAEKAMR